MGSKQIHVSIHGLDIGDGFPVRIMGVLNVSQESFYKKSIVDCKGIAEKARQMIDNGADFLDIGGRSTAPHAQPIQVQEECERVSKALESLLPTLISKRILVSIDTQYTPVAKVALEIFETHGMADQFVLNDVSGLTSDPDLASWIAETRKPCIIMASHGRPGDSLGIDQTIQDINRSLTTLQNKAYPVNEKAIIDPAIGRWIPEKLPLYDVELIHDLARFRSIGQPILVAISRKSFIGEILGEKNPDNRYIGTLSATAIAVFNGAHVIRTHDIDKETRDAIRMAESIKNKSGEKN